MLNKITAILECSRIFSLPMTIFSWLIIFVYSIMESGNIGYGILALLGISLAHLGTNVLDDYFDYKALVKQTDFDRTEYLKKAQKPKCRYIITGRMNINEVLILALIYFGIAGLIGLFFFIKCGIGVLYFGLLGGFLATTYSFLSRLRLSEIAVALAYGPALFGGVFYVMTNTYSWNVILLSIPSTILTVILLYIHTVMDFDKDLNDNKKTLANLFDSQLDSLIILKYLLILSYITIPLLCIFDILDWQVFSIYLTIPLAKDLYKSMVDFATNQESVPEHKWYHFPMENMEYIEKIQAQNFMIRMYQARNLMIYFSLLLTISIILAL